jgi:hypothetical protein
VSWGGREVRVESPFDVNVESPGSTAGVGFVRTDGLWISKICWQRAHLIFFEAFCSNRSSSYWYFEWQLGHSMITVLSTSAEDWSGR